MGNRTDDGKAGVFESIEPNMLAVDTIEPRVWVVCLGM